jgi:hypothetical protein
MDIKDEDKGEGQHQVMPLRPLLSRKLESFERDAGHAKNLGLRDCPKISPVDLEPVTQNAHI